MTIEMNLYCVYSSGMRQNPAVLSGVVSVLTGMKVSGRGHAVSSASRSK